MGKLILNGKEYIRSIPSPFPPIIYSKEEREVGLWADGKPLYQKTVHINSLPSTTYSQVQYAHGILNVDMIVDYNGVVRWASGSVAKMIRVAIFSSSAQDNFASNIAVEVDKTNILIAVGSNRSSMNADVTILYTKTTDTPGSGHWGTNGAPAKHYSTTEQVIGTWIDGKPLYEKTVIVPVSSCTITNKVMTIPFTSANEKLLRIVDAFTSDSTYSRIEYGGETHASNSTDANYIRFGWYYGSFCLYTANTSYWTNLGDITIIYQYTKTTD